MKPPRYLLREAVVAPLLRELAPARALELGHGRGQMLLTLAACGFQGLGFDPSTAAREHARQRLRVAGVDAFELVEEWPAEERFDLLVFFEVIGYVDDPREWLRRQRQLLNPGARIIFSFTNSRHQGIAEAVTGGMRCFSRDEMRGIVTAAGYRIETIINYGFPLANLLRWVRLPAYLGKGGSGATRGAGRRQQIDHSGFTAPAPWIRAGTAVFNSFLIRPFVWLQRPFRDTSLGTGFVVVARLLDNREPREKAAQSG